MYLYSGETIYIAGPECFYPTGYDLWHAMEKEARFFGFRVAMPNDDVLDLTHTDLRLNADAIFESCAAHMNDSTAIIADLELYRGSEPDGGTVFEIGMAYARGLRCYGFTRDKRDMIYKHQDAHLCDGLPYDGQGRPMAYYNLPFCPSLVGACKIIEGRFGDALRLLMLELDEERKACRQRPVLPSPAPKAEKRGRPCAYLAGPERFAADAGAVYASMKQLCAVYDFDAVTPVEEADDGAKKVCADPYARAYKTFDRCQRQVRDCDLLLANLEDFHGLEPSSDVAFECGMAWQLGKKCYAYQPDLSIMRERIPHRDPQHYDMYGNIIENFNYPANLMFASAMPILGSLEEALRAAAHEFAIQ